MSLFGKILAVLNVFAVVGALALMAMNYSKRQSWEYAVFRQDLMINGLPLDDKETDGQQNLVVEKIGEKTQQDLFKQASPSTPVATQEAEVNRVKGQLSSQIQSAGDKKKQIYALARILAPMALTIEQRQRLFAYQTHLRDDNTFAALKRRLEEADRAAAQPQPQGRAKPYEERFHDALAATFTDPLGPLAEEFLAVKKANAAAPVDKALEQALDNQLTQLQGQFEQMFRDALNGGEGIKPGAPSQQKRTIARLLLNMVEVLPSAAPGGEAKPDLVNNPAYKRFVVVVGVKSAVEAANDQAGILQELAFQTGVERLRERSLFAEVDEHTSLLAFKKKELETHEEALTQRRRDVKVYEEQLAAERRQTARRLGQLRQLSNALFDERVKLRQNTEDNQKLEKDIRALEEGR
jgi:hypothetical protein